jgi:predicted RNA-binding Zn-ribbon protein involved in translation (DUF1610 family)
MGTQPVQPQAMMKFNCPQCQSEVIGPSPIPRMFNAPEVSVITYTHAKLTKCPGCGTTYVCLLSGIDQEGKVNFAWTPVQTKQSAIAPGTDQNMKNALQTTELASKIKLN